MIRSKNTQKLLQQKQKVKKLHESINLQLQKKEIFFHSFVSIRQNRLLFVFCLTFKCAFQVILTKIVVSGMYEIG